MKSFIDLILSHRPDCLSIQGKNPLLDKVSEHEHELGLLLSVMAQDLVYSFVLFFRVHG